MNEHPEAEDAPMTRKTLAYLEACSHMFENGFLSHKKIVDINSEVLKSISDGYDFFCNWITQILDKGVL